MFSVIPVPRLKGLALARNALDHMEQWCLSEANVVRDVLGDSSPVVELLRSKASFLRGVNAFLDEDAKEEDDDA